MPTTAAEAEKYILERVGKARAELYRLRNGDVLDESIARWKRTLAIHDREAAAVLSEDPAKPHRWTVSPSMALRAEKHLEGLLQRQAELLDGCHKDAHQIVADLYEHAGPGQAEGESLCPPKENPLPQAGFEVAETTTSNTSNNGGAESLPTEA